MHVDASAKSHIFRNGHSGYAYFCLRAVVVHKLQFPRSTPLRFNTKFLAWNAPSTWGIAHKDQYTSYLQKKVNGETQHSNSFLVNSHKLWCHFVHILFHHALLALETYTCLYYFRILWHKLLGLCDVKAVPIFAVWHSQTYNN